MRTLPLIIALARSQTAFQLLLAGMLAACCAGSTLFGQIAAEYKPQVGEVHADFTLPNIADRAAVSLAQYRGKKVLLIHFASW